MDRDQLREKQDKLIKLCEARHLNEDLRISADYPESPTIRELRYWLYDEYETVIDDAISYLQNL